MFSSQILLVLICTIAIILFLWYGFSYKVKNEKIERDQVREMNAMRMEPTTKFAKDGEQVTIVEKEECVATLNFNKLDDEDEILSTSDNESIEQQENEQVSKCSFLSIIRETVDRIKAIFLKSNEEEDQIKPDGYYQINVVKKDESEFLASDVRELCEKCNLKRGAHDLFYHYDPANNETFRICGGNEPYGFSDENPEDVSYSAICLVMVLPEKGLAENAYLDMAQFAYILSKELDGEMVDKRRIPYTEERILLDRKVLIAYDKGN